MSKEKEIIEAEEVKEDSKMEVGPDTSTNPTEPSIVVSLVGVKLMCDIIDLASLRGAFQPGEFSTIGNLYIELKKHLPVDPTKETEEDSDDQPELNL